MTTTPNWPEFSAGAGEMEKLIGVSQYYGSCTDFVIAGGGNTSAKTADVLYVKASGHGLSTIGEDGFVAMDRQKLQQLLSDDLGSDAEQREALFKKRILAARLDPEKNQRPSVECLLHELMPQTYVVHSHSTVVNAIACCNDGAKLTEEMFGDDVIWSEFVEPGYNLAREIGAALRSYTERTGKKVPVGIIMQNHGLLVCGDEPAEIRERTDAIVAKISQRINACDAPFGKLASAVDDTQKHVNAIAPLLRGLLATSESLKIAQFSNSDAIMKLVCGADGQTITNNGPLTPDQIVYCGSFPMWFELADGETPEQTIERLTKAIADHAAAHSDPPLAVLVKNLGMFAVGDDVKAADTIGLVYTDAVRVMCGATSAGGVHPMETHFREFIESWEVEAYRKSIAKKAASGGRVAGKVAMVTGAAQGFGLEIARKLVDHGACVVLADINEQGAQSAAADICSASGPGRAIGLAINVTDGESIQSAVDKVVCQFGGLDVLVANAGVLKAESVKTQSEKDFDFVTNVNYKGYFLCVQKVSPVLALQRKAKADYYSDIVQINSKSGLTGSNRNGAYAGSKFGGIGLTQSFALELIEDGVKVNSICPGNFFDGPLWSNPENGLFVQYLRTGKVPGAKTIEEVRKFYEAKVPMGRGCETTDVVRAICYLIEQKYETGQAVPVTGGQVMLS